MWIDFTENIYQYGNCDTDLVSDTDISETKRKIWYYMIYKILHSIPLSIFMSFIVISLTYRTFISLVDYIFNYKSLLIKQNIKESSRDTCFCSICNVNDEHEIIYSKFDLDYVLNLFNRNDELFSGKNLTDIDLKNLNEKLKFCKLIKNKKSIFNKIYKPDRNFRFTSRYINSVLVTCVALYYFVLVFGYFVIIYTTVFSKYLSILDKSADKGKQLVDFFSSEQSIKYGDICGTIPELDCVDALKDITIYSLPRFPKVESIISPRIKELASINFSNTIEAIFIVPIFAAYIICIIQMFLFVRESRLHLQQLYKGECEFIVKSKNLSNASIGKYKFFNIV